LVLLDSEWLPIWQPFSFSPKTEIIPHLWVGGSAAVKQTRDKEGWTLVCVRETQCYKASNVIHIPVLRADRKWRAGKRALDDIADAIDLGLGRGDQVLVHCWEGVERSPLSVVWYLATRQGYTFDAAYEHVRDLRPQVVDRRAWLTKVAAKQMSLPRQRGNPRGDDGAEDGDGSLFLDWLVTRDQDGETARANKQRQPEPRKQARKR
jgi:hypothetical protein